MKILLVVNMVCNGQAAFVSVPVGSLGALHDSQSVGPSPGSTGPNINSMHARVSLSLNCCIKVIDCCHPLDQSESRDVTLLPASQGDRAYKIDHLTIHIFNSFWCVEKPSA